jgi:hypothetical protein
MKCLLADSRVDPCATDNMALKAAIRRGQQEAAKLLFPKAVVDGSLFKRLGFHKKESDTNTAMCELVLRSHPSFWPRIIGNYDAAHGATGSARAALCRIEVHSSFVLLLCVKSSFSPTIAGRVADVLREVCEEWLRFRYVTLQKPVETSNACKFRASLATRLYLATARVSGAMVP